MVVRIENVDTGAVSLDAVAKAFPKLSMLSGECGSNVLLEDVEYVVQLENEEIALVKKGGDVAFKIHKMNYEQIVIF